MQMTSKIKHKTGLPKQNSHSSNRRTQYQRSYPSMNALYCLENLHAVILSSASLCCRVNTRRDFAAILNSRVGSRGRLSTNQTIKTKICVHKFACTNVT